MRTRAALPAKFNTDPLLTEQEAADFLCIKPATLCVWRSSGRYNLAYVKVGRSVRYKKSVLQAFTDSRVHDGKGGHQ